MSKNTVRMNRKQRRTQVAAQQRDNNRTPPPKAVRVTIPKILSFKQNDFETKFFFMKLRNLINNNTDLILDIDQIQQLDLAAAVVLIAEMDRWRRRRGCPIISSPEIRIPSHIKELLEGLGFFSIIGVKPNNLEIRPKDRIYSYSTSLKADGKILQQISKQWPDLLRNSSYVPLIEAISNVVEHAYKGAEENPEKFPHLKLYSEKRWWIGCKYSLQENSLDIALVDLGVSIPSSIEHFHNVDRRYKMQGDVGLIYWGINSTVTRHNQTHRGKGMWQIVETNKLHPKNKVTIISGNGILIVKANQQPNTSGANSTAPFQGTIIKWKLYSTPHKEQINA